MADNPDNDRPDDNRSEHSRRDVVQWLGAASAAAGLGISDAANGQGVPSSASAMPQREPLETLTPAEADVLEAFCARLIPTDALGPGAAEARAAHYIDRSLGGALSSSREAYRLGLAALDAYARSTKGAAFAKLSAGDQEAVLTEMEKNTATGFAPNSAAFFALVRDHTLQGTFGDPYYGGNAGFIGWDLIGYPGIRLAVTEKDQAMSPHLAPVRKSAYDFPMFDRRSGAISSRNSAPADTEHMPDGMGNMRNGN